MNLKWAALADSAEGLTDFCIWWYLFTRCRQYDQCSGAELVYLNVTEYEASVAA